MPVQFFVAVAGREMSRRDRELPGCGLHIRFAVFSLRTRWAQGTLDGKSAALFLGKLIVESSVIWLEQAVCLMEV